MDRIESCDDGVRELRFPALLLASELTVAAQKVQTCRPGDAAEGDDHFFVPQQFELAIEVWRAVGHFLWQRLVAGRRAAGCCRDVNVAQDQGVVAVFACRLVGQPRAVQRREKKIAAAITGEDAAGAIRPVRARGQADEPDACVLVAEAGHGFGPVCFVGVGAALGLPHLPAILPQPPATPAGFDLRVKLFPICYAAHIIDYTTTGMELPPREFRYIDAGL